MTLSIIDSMLRGDLRRQILCTLKTEKEISLLWRELTELEKGNQSLMAIELALIAAVETSGLAKVSADYKDDREVRQGAEEARKQGMSFGEDDYTRVDEKLSLEGVFSPATETTPTDKFLHLLVKVECRRTEEFLLMLVKSVHDDAVVRTYIRKLFSSITSFCKDTSDLYIRESLTQLYFEVYHTFRRVLEDSSLQTYETDFENFVFDWKGEFPEKEVVTRYNEKVAAFVPSLNVKTIAKNTEAKESPVPEAVIAKDKFTLFLEEADKYTFSEMPKVKELGTPQKVRQLVESMLLQKDTDADTFGHTAAWLEFLDFYKWIADHHVSGYKKTQFDAWCTEHIMNKATGTAFRHYRLSVSVDSSDTRNASYKYNGWKFRDSVKEEYEKLLQK